MKFIKKHTNALVGIGIIALIVIALLLIKKELFFNENTAIYGSRIEGIEKHKISNETKEKVKSSVSDNTKDVKIRITGRLIYIEMKANDDTSLDAAKGLGNKTLEAFSDVEKKYYDIQVIIENDSNTNQFPIIGYKHHSKDALVWTKDRAES